MGGGSDSAVNPSEDIVSSASSEVVRYDIETLADLVGAAHRSGNVDGLLADLRTWLELAVAAREVNIKPFTWNDRFIWKDDGVSGLTGVNINIEERPE